MEKNPSEQKHLIRSQEVYLDKLRRRNFSPETLRTYATALKSFRSFLAAKEIERFQDVTEATVGAYRLHLIERKLAAATLHVFLRTVRALFNDLEESGHILINPCRGLIIPRYDRKLLPVPTEEDVKRILAQPDLSHPRGTRDRALLEVAYGCALRREELARLKIHDPDLQGGYLRVAGKGNKDRVVPLGKKAIRWIKSYFTYARPKLLRAHIDEQALWVTLSGTPLSAHHASKIIRLYALDAGLEKISAHSLRRACATHMLRKGAHPVQVQELLGHATMHTLNAYLRLTITDIQHMHRKSKPGR